MAKSGAGTVLLIVAVIAGLLFFSGPILAFIGNLTGYEGSIPSLGDIWQQFLDAIGFGGGGGGNADGSTAVAFVVYFTDGTKQEINMDMSYSLMPFTITFQGKTVSRVNISVLARMNSALGAWNSSVSQQMELYKKPSTTPATSSTGTFTSSGASWSANSVKVLSTMIIQGSTIDNAIRAYGNGDYLLQVYADVTLNVGDSEFTAEALRGGLDITFKNGGLSVITPDLSIKGLT